VERYHIAMLIIVDICYIELLNSLEYTNAVLGLDTGDLINDNRLISSLNEKANALENTMSFLPAVPLQSIAIPTGRRKKPPNGKGKKEHTSSARKDSLMDTNVYPCEQLHDSQIGLSTGATDCCPICQIDCIYHTRLKI
jgi:hypothetical protein